MLLIRERTVLFRRAVRLCTANARGRGPWARSICKWGQRWQPSKTDKTWGTEGLCLVYSMPPKKAEWQCPVSSQLCEERRHLRPHTQHAHTYLGRHRLPSTMNTVNTQCLGAWGLVEANPPTGPLRTGSFLIPRRTRSPARSGPCHPPWSVLAADSCHVGCSWMPRARAGPQGVQLLTSLTAQPRYQPILQSEWTKTSTQRGLRRTWNRTKTHGSRQLDFFLFLVLKATVMFVNDWLKLFLCTEVQLARNTS